MQKKQRNRGPKTSKLRLLSLLTKFCAMKLPFSFFNCFSSSSSKISVEKYDTEDLQGKNFRSFSYSELEVATNGFSSSNKIGEGGFGSVYKGRLEDGKIVAIKVLSTESKQGDKEFMSEIASMSNITHKNLLKLHGCCINGPKRILVYDCMEFGDLAQTFLVGKKQKAKFNWKLRRKILLGIARGIAYIHEEVKPHIVHRDIKASNILLDHNFTPKVSDFGLSRLFLDDMSHISTRVAGTLGYLSPEYAISGHFTRKSDVYSFGVLLLEIVTGRTALCFDLQLGEHHLAEEAWEMHKEGNLMQLVDPTLNITDNNSESTEALKFLKVALLCLQQKSSLRPIMSKAFKMLRDEINIDTVQITEPGLITDFMDVKIVATPSSEGKSSNSKVTRSLIKIPPLL